MEEMILKIVKSLKRSNERIFPKRVAVALPCHESTARRYMARMALDENYGLIRLSERGGYTL